MTDHDIQERRRQLDAAQTPEERIIIERVWQEKSLRCQAHTAERVKQLLKDAATKTDIHEIVEKIDRLHSSPKWKDNKLEWLKANWMWVLVLLYMLQSMFGVNVSAIIERIFESFSK